MSTFRRRPRARDDGSRPAADHRHHHLRRWRATLAARGPSLDLAADPEHLLTRYRRLEADGGHAPGPDGLTYADLGPSEVACLMREVGAAVRRGDYRPGPARRVPIP